MPRRGDKSHAKTLDVIEGIAQGVNFQLTAVARTGVDLANRQAAAKPRAGGLVHLCRERGEFGIGRGSLRERGFQQTFEQSFSHGIRLEIMARVRAVERLVAEGEISDDVPLDRCLEQGPLEPGGIAQVAPLDPRIGAKADPGQNVATEAYDNGHALASYTGRVLRRDAGEN